MSDGELIKVLKGLCRENKITVQQYNTYKGQILSGNKEGCIVGLKRKKLLQ